MGSIGVGELTIGHQTIDGDGTDAGQSSLAALDGDTDGLAVQVNHQSVDFCGIVNAVAVLVQQSLVDVNNFAGFIGGLVVVPLPEVGMCGGVAGNCIASQPLLVQQFLALLVQVDVPLEGIFCGAVSNFIVVPVISEGGLEPVEALNDIAILIHIRCLGLQFPSGEGQAVLVVGGIGLCIGIKSICFQIVFVGNEGVTDGKDILVEGVSSSAVFLAVAVNVVPEISVQPQGAGLQLLGEIIGLSRDHEFIDFIIILSDIPVTVPLQTFAEVHAQLGQLSLGVLLSLEDAGSNFHRYNRDLLVVDQKIHIRCIFHNPLCSIGNVLIDVDFSLPAIDIGSPGIFVAVLNKLGNVHKFAIGHIFVYDLGLAVSSYTAVAVEDNSKAFFLVSNAVVVGVDPGSPGCFVSCILGDGGCNIDPCFKDISASRINRIQRGLGSCGAVGHSLLFPDRAVLVQVSNGEGLLFVSDVIAVAVGDGIPSCSIHYILGNLCSNCLIPASEGVVLAGGICHSGGIAAPCHSLIQQFVAQAVHINNSEGLFLVSNTVVVHVDLGSPGCNVGCIAGNDLVLAPAHEVVVIAGGVNRRNRSSLVLCSIQNFVNSITVHKGDDLVLLMQIQGNSHSMNSGLEIRLAILNSVGVDIVSDGNCDLSRQNILFAGCGPSLGDILNFHICACSSNGHIAVLQNVKVVCLGQPCSDLCFQISRSFASGRNDGIGNADAEGGHITECDLHIPVANLSGDDLVVSDLVAQLRDPVLMLLHIENAAHIDVVIGDLRIGGVAQSSTNDIVQLLIGDSIFQHIFLIFVHPNDSINFCVQIGVLVCCHSSRLRNHFFDSLDDFVDVSFCLTADTADALLSSFILGGFPQTPGVTLGAVGSDGFRSFLFCCERANGQHAQDHHQRQQHRKASLPNVFHGFSLPFAYKLRFSRIPGRRKIARKSILHPPYPSSRHSDTRIVLHMHCTTSRA